MSVKKQWIAVILVLLIMIIIFGIFFTLREKSIDRISGLQIINGEVTISPTSADYENIPLTFITMENRDQYQGYLVIDLIHYFKFEPEEFKDVYFSALDGSRIIVSLEEIETKEVMLAFEDQDNSLRLIFPQDGFRNRWLKNIISLELK